MTLNERLISCLSPIVPVVVSDDYVGDESEYIVFSYSELPVYFGDDLPEFTRYLITIDWFLPPGINPRAKKRRIREALLEAGLDAPEFSPDHTAQRQHFVIETEWLDGEN